MSRCSPDREPDRPVYVDVVRRLIVSLVNERGDLLKRLSDETSEPICRASPAAADVIAERLRQLTKEGWTPAHDDEHTDESLAQAAACYALPPEARDYVSRYDDGKSIGKFVPMRWPGAWSVEWWKSHDLDSFPEPRRRDLVKAGALILAEIERLDRAPLKASDG
jgi:hypothetical protein